MLLHDIWDAYLNVLVHGLVISKEIWRGAIFTFSVSNQLFRSTIPEDLSYLINVLHTCNSDARRLQSNDYLKGQYCPPNPVVRKYLHMSLMV